MRLSKQSTLKPNKIYAKQELKLDMKKHIK